MVTVDAEIGPAPFPKNADLSKLGTSFKHGAV